MESVNVEAVTRKPGKNIAYKLRKEGYIPAVLYGKGMESIPIAVADKKFCKILQTKGRNVLLDVIVNGSTHNAIIKEIQNDTLKGKLLHVDFQIVSMYEKIESTVPLKLKGVGILESKGAIVQHQIWELNIKCLPDKIPEELDVDISNLDVGDTLYIRDLIIPEGVEVVDDPDEVVLTVVVPKAEDVKKTEPEEEATE
ncbi:50S ribosomal protein L25 [Aceticella autotrophica]|uniref:Large ribosomal subunit protein bL25 n=1 Tax=Aceticella autotrophica TaxID=2755338 RepID=A0A975AX42_9THEO|nr:50S ribosomal protein L25 [Aceticella autotrophica]QSZ28100.1 50S ribosomal protein L25 [Aceticella autotrophica]